MELQENKSITFETAAKMIVKQDGSKVPFESSVLKSKLSNFLNGLNKNYINLDIITEKVSKGIYNGKYRSLLSQTSECKSTCLTYSFLFLKTIHFKNFNTKGSKL